ncbi:hypothetical protein SCHPADRAFT_946336 [Schizopora paradoxa]|uniref:Peptidase M12A domain-containing protein n=1 Tax=Schizopora paradoxa TaxID=27342 RepID=A0A0H2R9J2_9AGAM|nr:hypothetical protein SCHPADRAFT_946336 [Schizopora paradoxa]
MNAPSERKRNRLGHAALGVLLQFASTAIASALLYIFKGRLQELLFENILDVHKDNWRYGPTPGHGIIMMMLAKDTLYPIVLLVWLFLSLILTTLLAAWWYREATQCCSSFLCACCGLLGLSTCIGGDGRRDDHSFDDIPSMRAAFAPRNRLWDFRNGRCKVYFIGGSEKLRERVLKHFRKWMDLICVDIEVVDRPDLAYTRISFDPRDPKGSWSKVGTDALSVKSPAATMNLAFTDDMLLPPLAVIIQEEALHEWGHFLGMYHEHSSSSFPHKMDKKAIKQKKVDWSEKDVEDNYIFKHGFEDCSTVSAFDEESIMLYPLDAKMVKCGFSSGYNTDLSATDMATFVKAYADAGLITLKADRIVPYAGALAIAKTAQACVECSKFRDISQKGRHVQGGRVHGYEARTDYHHHHQRRGAARFSFMGVLVLTTVLFLVFKIGLDYILFEALKSHANGSGLDNGQSQEPGKGAQISFMELHCVRSK